MLLLQVLDLGAAVAVLALVEVLAQPAALPLAARAVTITLAPMEELEERRAPKTEATAPRHLLVMAAQAAAVATARLLSRSQVSGATALQAKNSMPRTVLVVLGAAAAAMLRLPGRAPMAAQAGAMAAAVVVAAILSRQ